MTQKIAVKQNPESKVPVEIMAEAIERISRSMRYINQSRVSRKMIVALIHDNSKLGKRDIEIVLNNLDALEKNYLKPRAKQ